jgi:acyl carrier protein
VLAVSHPDRALRESEIRAFCRERLSLFKIPRIFEFVPALPRDPMGKIQRRELASADQYVRTVREAVAANMLDQIQRASPSRQRSLVMQVVERQAAAVLGYDGQSLPHDVGFVDLGMDSFGSVELLTRLDLLFAFDLPQTFTFDHPTIAAAAEALVALMQHPSTEEEP